MWGVIASTIIASILGVSLVYLISAHLRKRFPEGTNQENLVSFFLYLTPFLIGLWVMMVVIMSLGIAVSYPDTSLQIFGAQFFWQALLGGCVAVTAGVISGFVLIRHGEEHNRERS